MNPDAWWVAFSPVRELGWFHDQRIAAINRTTWLDHPEQWVDKLHDAAWG